MIGNKTLFCEGKVIRREQKGGVGKKTSGHIPNPDTNTDDLVTGHIIARGRSMRIRQHVAMGKERD